MVGWVALERSDREGIDQHLESRLAISGDSDLGHRARHDGGATQSYEGDQK